LHAILSLPVPPVHFQAVKWAIKGVDIDGCYIAAAKNAGVTTPPEAKTAGATQLRKRRRYS
jgi:hypothetical protein